MPSNALRRYVVGQFSRPAGPAGRLAGWIMGARASNRRRNDWTVEVLDIAPGHRVLEIGFGPGFALGLAARRATDGSVVGVDHSELMRRVASRRNRESVRAGRIRLFTGAAADLAGLTAREGLGPFDRIFAVNVSMFWDDPAAVATMLRTQLVPGGRLALTVQPRNAGASDADSVAIGERLAAVLRHAGFVDLRTEYCRDLKPSAVCVIGSR